MKLELIRKLISFLIHKLKIAKEIDWKTEYLDAKFLLKSVKNVNEAIKSYFKIWNNAY